MAPATTPASAIKIIIGRVAPTDNQQCQISGLHFLLGLSQIGTQESTHYERYCSASRRCYWHRNFTWCDFFRPPHRLGDSRSDLLPRGSKLQSDSRCTPQDGAWKGLVDDDSTLQSLLDVSRFSWTGRFIQELLQFCWRRECRRLRPTTQPLVLYLNVPLHHPTGQLNSRLGITRTSHHRPGEGVRTEEEDRPCCLAVHYWRFTDPSILVEANALSIRGTCALYLMSARASTPSRNTGTIPRIAIKSSRFPLQFPADVLISGR